MWKKFLFSLLAVSLAAVWFWRIIRAQDSVSCVKVDGTANTDTTNVVAVLGTSTESADCYTSLRGAIGAVSDGGTITMVDDDHGSSFKDEPDKYEIVINKSLTINGNNKTVYWLNTYDYDWSSHADHDIFINSLAGNVTIENLRITEFWHEMALQNNIDPLYISAGYNWNLVLNGVTIDNYNRYGLTLWNGTFAIDGLRIEWDTENPFNAEDYFQWGIRLVEAEGTITNSSITWMWAHSSVWDNGEVGWSIQLQGDGSIILQGEDNELQWDYSIIVTATNPNNSNEPVAWTVIVAGGNIDGDLDIESASATLRIKWWRFTDESAVNYLATSNDEDVDNDLCLVEGEVVECSESTFYMSSRFSNAAFQVVVTTDWKHVDKANTLALMNKKLTADQKALSTLYQFLASDASSDSSTEILAVWDESLLFVNRWTDWTDVFRSSTSWLFKWWKEFLAQDHPTLWTADAIDISENPILYDVERAIAPYRVDAEKDGVDKYHAISDTEGVIWYTLHTTDGGWFYAPIVYTIIYNANGWEWTMANQEITYWEEAVALSENAFTKAWHSFAGWNTQADGQWTAYAADATISNLLEDLTLYAHWTANTYTITFDKNDEKATWEMEAQTFTHGVAQALSQNAFTKAWYNFAWWATSADGNVVHKNKAQATFTADTTLYAKWTKKSSWWGSGWGSTSSTNTGATANSWATASTWTTVSTWSNLTQQPEVTDNQTTDNTGSNASDNDSQSEVLSNGYTREFNEAYEFAHKNWITTMWTIEEANMYGGLTRIAMAKMLSQYAINVLGKKPANVVVPNFPDVSEELDADYDNWVTLAYQLWIMWIWIENFRPYDSVTRAEFATALSRMLFGTSDGEPWYATHLEKLMNEKIITNDDPNLKELRGYVMIMLMRSAQ